MNINHHLSDILLFGYANGELSEAFNLVIATHISLCDECRVRLNTYEALGGAVLAADNAPVEMASDSLAQCLARAKSVPRAERNTRPVSQGNRGSIPVPLVDYIGPDLKALKWRLIGMGVKQAMIKCVGTETVRLLSIPPGRAVPDHGHGGIELTLVLQGAFSDEAGRFGPGDIEIADENVKHTPHAEGCSACICLIAMQEPLRFKGLLPRIMQPFIGI